MSPDLHDPGTATAAAGALPVASEELLDDLLEKTSRTFALAIPRLPEPTCREVGIAYLLFRIADTFEDASVPWSRRRQIRALGDFADLLAAPDGDRAAALAARWLEEPRPSGHAGYLELLAAVPEVVGAWHALAPAARDSIAHHTRRTAHGMAGFVARSGDERLQLADLRDLQGYCYVVAGIVGEMLTELFVLGRPGLEETAPFLRRRAAAFGEALQLVNILKDAADDREEGRSYLPAGVDRGRVFALARGDLDVAAEYVVALQRAGAPEGLVQFTGLPVLLARATLDRVEEKGPGAKLTRLQVLAIERRMKRRLAQGEDAVPLAGC